MLRQRAAVALAVVVPSVAVAAGWITTSGSPAVVIATFATISWSFAILSGGSAALRRLRARQVSEAQEPRLHNIAAGLSGDLGIAKPALCVIPRGAPNALVCRAGFETVVAVTRSLLESYTRTEVEAVVAHCLVRSATTELRLLSLAWSSGPLLRAFVPKIGFDDDLRAAALTRYPPALASAISKASPYKGFAPFWFVGDGAYHRPSSERIAALADL